MIKVKNVSKSFDGFRALDALTLTVPKGSVYGLVGSNGAGKTTIIKHLCGIYRQDSGLITIDGKNAYENNAVKSRLCYISDDLYFFPTYSVHDMAEFYRGIYPDWNEERFQKLGEIFKIDPRRKVRRLSKGMQKQVSFWLGISTMPEIMILDEPVDGLDPVMRKSVWQLMLADVAERGMTVLVSSHNLRELEDVCDHVGIMHRGRVVLEKSLDDVKGNIHKIQLAFSGGVPTELLGKMQILHNEKFGSVSILIVRGNGDMLRELISGYSPVIFDILPLTLEEVFIYELGGKGYELENIII